MCHFLRTITITCLVSANIASATSSLSGDIAPLGNPDGILNAADYLVLQRLVLKQLDPSPTELVVADVAPLGNPDGRLNAGDLVVLMRAINGQVVLPPLADTQHPSIPDITLITVTDNGDGTVTVTGQAASLEAGTSVTLTNYDNGSIALTTVGADGSFSVNLTASTGQVFSIAATDLTGNTSPQAALGVGQLLDLAIIEPAQGITFSGKRILVRGTFQGPATATVTVNGFNACTQAGQFFAVIPVDTGSNSLTVKVMTADGLSLSRSVDATSSGPAPVEILADAGCGLAPYTVRFSVTNNTTVPIQSIQGDFDSDGLADVTAVAGSSEISYAYPTAGIATAVITVTDDQGGQYNWAQPVYTSGSSDLDNRLRTVFTGMTNRLANGATEGALNAFSATAAPKYREVFNALGSGLTSAVGRLGTLETSALSGEMAEYFLVRDDGTGVESAFPVYFLKGEDGVWRIDGM